MERNAHQALIQYYELVNSLCEFTEELCQWGLEKMVYSLWQPLSKIHNDYLEILSRWVKWAQTLEAKTSEQLAAFPMCCTSERL